jgi:hypothetical protein
MRRRSHCLDASDATDPCERHIAAIVLVSPEETAQTGPAGGKNLDGPSAGEEERVGRRDGRSRDVLPGSHQGIPIQIRMQMESEFP